MSLPQMPTSRDPKEMRKALLRLRMEMHRQEVRLETAQLLDPIRRLRNMGSSVQHGLDGRRLSFWNLAAVVALGFVTGKGVRGGGLARLLGMSSSLVPLVRALIESRRR
ncbi:hypothetical protein [Pseudomonas cremoricolorata]|uniref:Uncharacterized protein n=1 Tax=Pseudomonas cremoricolorata TaxID=157783 RepID=A0A089WNF1_9PSED|nr:hypothetical protein [Pseudomonas cremoricolorata]AIR90121.1 hypothetical protein LK03_12805 [Pseudomonas cremoricolorata]